MMEYSKLCAQVQDDIRPAQEAVLALIREATTQLWPGEMREERGIAPATRPDQTTGTRKVVDDGGRQAGR